MLFVDELLKTGCRWVYGELAVFPAGYHNLQNILLLLGIEGIFVFEEHLLVKEHGCIGHVEFLVCY